MSEAVPRLRMFAGPNGSGKSTIKEILPLQWLGVYVNADEMEKSSRYVRSLELLSRCMRTGPTSSTTRTTIVFG